MSTLRKSLQNSVAVSVGCRCRRPKIARLTSGKSTNQTSKEKSRRKIDLPGSSSSSWPGGDDPANTLSQNDQSFSESPEAIDAPVSSTNISKTISCFRRLQGKIGESVAVVKNSDDPYLDFRYSMLHMILEKEIYSREELRELLNCFLSLNSPCHHEIIVRAFMEIWNGVFSVNPSFQNR